MARQQVWVKAEARYSLELELYADAWQEQCDEEHDGDEPLVDYPPVPLEFALEKFQEELEENAETFMKVFEGASVDVGSD